MEKNGDNGLSEDEQKVFALLAEARKQYEVYLEAQEAFGLYDFQVPASEDYNWEKPLTLVVCQ